MQKNDFSVGSLPRTITKLAMPMIGAQLVNVLYNIVDRIYIGKLPNSGLTELAALGIAMPIITMVSAFAALAGHGGAPLSSIARGAKDPEKAQALMGNAFVLLLFFGVACTVAGLWFRAPLLRLFGASDETFPYAEEYLTIYLTGSVFVMIGLGLNPFINAQGFTRTGMATVVIGALANIALDPVFIYGLNMGVRGAALATVIAQGLSAAWTLRFLTGKKCIFRLEWRAMRLRWDLIRQICALGFSNFTMKLTESAVQTVCNRQLGLYGGDVYITVMTVINSVRQVIMLPMAGFSEGTQPVLSYNYGAKRLDRVRWTIRFLTVVSLGYSFLAFLAAQLAPEFLIRVFNQSPELLKVGVPAMRLYFSTFFAMGLQMAGQYSFVSLGKSWQATFFSLFRKAVIVVPLTLILPAYVGVNGVFYAEVVSDLVGSTACFITFLLTVWRRELCADLPKRGARK